MPRVIAVTGLPASGKTTLGRRVAGALGLELLDKDDDLEAGFAAAEAAGSGPIDRSALSRAADAAFRARAEARAADPACGGLVLVSFWRRPELSATSGTPTDWVPALAGPGGDVVELWCRCPPEVAVARFVARRRHPGHGDAARSPEVLLASFRALDALGSVGIGRLVAADTTAVGGEDGLLTELR